MRLEPELWDALGEICGREGMPLGELVRRVEGRSGRTSAVRVYTLAYFREAATEEGHRLAGHGQKAAKPSASNGGNGHPHQEARGACPD